jgi:NAD(P)-dependent dehydrogenase (short-subunit alcohol dehydrogenase family)
LVLVAVSVFVLDLDLGLDLFLVSVWFRFSFGDVISYSFSSTFFPFNQLSGYIASKAALDVFTRNLNIELGLWDIKTVQISPGTTLAHMMKC